MCIHCIDFLFQSDHSSFSDSIFLNEMPIFLHMLFMLE